MGQATDIEITVNEIKKLRTELYDVLAYHTGQTAEQIAIDSDRDKWMTAPEAKAYGLVDEVLFINPRKEKK
jgi:ATP-dependent Clp protease protease subunit